MTCTLRQQLFAGVLILSGFGTATGALADTGPAARPVEEIIVTARLRSESLAEVPVTVNAFSRQDIEDAGIRRPNDYLSLVPNVTLVEAQNAGTTFLTVRGITQVRNNEPPVAVAVDGMLQTSPNQFNQALLDMEQIEVLKGPQGALYGRNAIGGAINITTRGPSDEFSGRVQFGAGNGERFEGRASLAGPLAKRQGLVPHRRNLARPRRVSRQRQSGRTCRPPRGQERPVASRLADERSLDGGLQALCIQHERRRAQLQLAGVRLRTRCLHLRGRRRQRYRT